MKKIFTLLVVCFPLSVSAQNLEQIPISYTDYIERVCENNLSYAAEQLNIPLAEAQERAAALFNDPSLSVEYAYNDDYRMQMGQGVAVELSKTFSPGKRRARIDLASSERKLAEALLDDYLRTLRAEATVAYLEAVLQCRIYEMVEESHRRIAEIMASENRHSAYQELNELGCRNEVLQARADMENACAGLAVLLGEFSMTSYYLPSDGLSNEEPDYLLSELLSEALDNRADLEAAKQSIEVARKAEQLVRKERGMDFDISIGYNYNTEVRNELAPAPKFSGVTVAVAVPLKFSNLNKGDLQAAVIEAQQSELHYRQVQIEVQTEVMQAWNSYRVAYEQLSGFDEEMLTATREEFEERLADCNDGEYSLHALQEAHYAYCEAQTLYLETLCNCNLARVGLEMSVGR